MAVLSGVTRNSVGTAIGAATVLVFNSSNVLVASGVSDGSGNYSITTPGTGPYWVAAYKTGTPDLAGITNRDLAATTSVPLFAIDMDHWGDVDDSAAVYVAHRLQDLGEAEIIVMGINTSVDMAASAAKIINSYFGRGSIPIGAYQGSGFDAGTHPQVYGGSDFPSVIVTEFGARYSATAGRTSYSSPTTVFRTALAAAPNKSVKWITLGFTQNLAALLGSAADGIDGRTGAQLFSDKVSEIWGTWGNLPLPNFDYNSGWTTTAAGFTSTALGYLNAMSPIIPMYFVDIDLGESWTSKPADAMDPAINPVKRIYNYAGFGTGTNGRYIYDLIPVLAAARGLAAAGCILNTSYDNGTLSINTTTKELSFTNGGAHGQTHFLASDGSTNLGTLFNAILDDEPANPNYGAVTRTNLVPYSEDLTLNMEVFNTTITTNTHQGPAGTGTTTFDTVTGNNVAGRAKLIAVVAANQTYTHSVFIRKTSGATLFPGATIQFRTAAADISEYGAILNTNTGVAYNASGWGSGSLDGLSVEDFDANYWRLKLTKLSPAGTTNAKLWYLPSCNGNGTDGTRGNGGSGSAVIGGCQFETGASATAYIRNDTGSPLTV